MFCILVIYIQVGIFRAQSTSTMNTFITSLLWGQNHFKFFYHYNFRGSFLFSRPIKDWKILKVDLRNGRSFKKKNTISKNFLPHCASVENFIIIKYRYPGYSYNFGIIHMAHTERRSLNFPFQYEVPPGLSCVSNII